jgi:hypothetical protein
VIAGAVQDERDRPYVHVTYGFVPPGTVATYPPLGWSSSKGPSTFYMGMSLSLCVGQFRHRVRLQSVDLREQDIHGQDT